MGATIVELPPRLERLANATRVMVECDETFGGYVRRHREVDDRAQKEMVIDCAETQTRAHCASLASLECGEDRRDLDGVPHVPPRYKVVAEHERGRDPCPFCVRGSAGKASGRACA